MPVHNGERYLGEAVESILAQTLEDFEFLVIDDGSTDSSVSIIEKRRDPRIRLVRNDGNLGLVASLNRGLELASGKYVARMDADDISAPQRIERQLDFLERNPTVAVLGTNLIRIHPDGTPCDDQPPPYPTGSAYLGWKIFWRCALQHPTVMMRKDVVRTLGGYQQVWLAEDYDLWLRISREHEIDNLREFLLSYRVHPESVSLKNKDEQMMQTADLVAGYLGEWLKEDVDSKVLREKITGQIVPGSGSAEYVADLMIKTLKAVRGRKPISLSASIRIKSEILFGHKLFRPTRLFSVKNIARICGA